MWMQKSMEGTSITSHGAYHQRNMRELQRQNGGNPYASSASFSSNSYGGSDHGNAASQGDWKSKILESGQWLGGKVIEYGGRLARGGSHDSIPDHMTHQMPRNDGRASWMADIRNSSSSYNSGGYNGSGGSNTYQNDFATERPKAYSDSAPYGQSHTYGNNFNSNNHSNTNSYNPSSHGKEGSRRVKKMSDHDSKKKKKSKASKKKYASPSSASESSEAESDASSIRESTSSATGSESDRSGDQRRTKNKVKKHQTKSKSKKKKKNRNGGFYSDDESSDEDNHKKSRSSPKAKNKKSSNSSNYSYSFDPSKLAAAPPAEDSHTSTSKSSKPSKGKKSSKHRNRRQSMESSESDPTSDKENHKTKKQHAKAKHKSSAAAKTSQTVDLLGVDLDGAPAPAASSAQPSVFDAFSDSHHGDPLQDLAGLNLNFTSQPAVNTTTVTPLQDPSREKQEQQQHAPMSAQFLNNLLPENSIVDLDSLACEKKKETGSPSEKRTLNDLQKAKGSAPPTPVMPMNSAHNPMMAGNGMMQMGSMNQMQMGGVMNSMQIPMQMQMQMVPAGQMMQPMMNMQQQQQQYAMNGGFNGMMTGNQQQTGYGNFPMNSSQPQNGGNSAMGGTSATFQ